MDRIGFRAYYIYTSAQLLLESNNIHINTSKLTHSLNELQKLVQGIVRVMKNPSSLMDAFSQIMDKYDPNHQMKHSISRLHPHILKLQKRMKQTWKQVINRSMLGTSYNLVMIVQALISFVCAFILETMYLAFIFMRYVYKSVAFILFDKEGREDLWKGIVSLFKTLHDEFFEPAKGLFKTLIVCIEILAPSILSIFIAPYGLFVKFLTTILMLSGSVIKLSSQDTSDDIANNLLPFLFKLVLRYDLLFECLRNTDFCEV